ncbi:hypothetical protein TREES_T100010765 [Tupaia chinensis]|uniref:Uncharacterized protein n=1 Tax=Tupaia chinensis TaxID=246437 RepID=L9KKZ5_TUPCH|nr:hypothetical protein TREES_T100010765 [Tupaia chinensis]
MRSSSGSDIRLRASQVRAAPLRTLGGLGSGGGRINSRAVFVCFSKISPGYAYALVPPLPCLHPPAPRTHAPGQGCENSGGLRRAASQAPSDGLRPLGTRLRRFENCELTPKLMI